MAMETENNENQVNSDKRMKKRRQRCLIVIVGAALLLMLLFIIILILALTVFKIRQPRTEIISASVEGIAPRLSLPAIQIQLNVTLDLKLLVENRNPASFRHGQGKSLLLYKKNQVGDTEIYPGLIPARGSSTLPCRLTLQVDELASNLTSLIQDVLGGQLQMETLTSIPGKVSFFGIIRKHIVAISKCQFTISVPDFKVKSEVCENKTKM